MNINSWNLSQTKNHFFIRQRKQAQRRHLEKLKNTKSAIELLKFAQTAKSFHNAGIRTPVADSQCQLKRKSSNSHQPFQDSMLSSVLQRVKSPDTNSTYVHNLRVSSSLSRIRHSKQIQKQNQKLYTRLIKTKPSISEIQLQKNHLNHKKYKENILKNKYLNPDYTKQVRTQHKSFSHLLLKPINYLAKTKQTKPFGSRVKQNVKGHFHRLTNLTDYKSTEDASV